MKNYKKIENKIESIESKIQELNIELSFLKDELKAPKRLSDYEFTFIKIADSMYGDHIHYVKKVKEEGNYIEVITFCFDYNNDMLIGNRWYVVNLKDITPVSNKEFKEWFTKNLNKVRDSLPGFINDLISEKYEGA